MKLSVALWGGFLLLSSRRSKAFQVQPGFHLAFSRASSSSSSSVSHLSAVVSINEGTPRDVGSMDEWAATCGVQRADGFQLNSEDGLDWSVYTAQDLPANSPVLAVPSNMMLSSSEARQELFYPAKEAVDSLNRLGASVHIPHFFLFLKVLLEYEKGDQSPWFPWLNSLPKLYYTAVSMTDFCYECLPPLVFRLARDERIKFNNFKDALKTIDGFSADTKADENLLKWAYNVVYTRSWGPKGEKEKYIIPMADMFNHGTDTEVDITLDENGNAMVYSTRDVPAGSPLRMSYGDPTNPSYLFATYGFLDESSPATFCKIMNIQATPAAKDIGYDFSKMLFYKDTGEISEEVWDVVLYDNLRTNPNVQRAFYEAHMNGDSGTKQAIHQEYFLDTSTSLKTHVDTFLEQLDMLSAKADGKDINEHPRLPVILKHNEFVKNTFLRVKERLDPMVAQAAGQPAMV